MVESVVIVCDQSPVGKNTTAETVRLGSGFVALGEMLECKVVYLGDAVYLLAKDVDFGAIHQDPVAEILEMADLSELEIWVLDSALKDAGMTQDDLIEYEFLKVVGVKEIAEAIGEADVTFRY